MYCAGTGSRTVQSTHAIGELPCTRLPSVCVGLMHMCVSVVFAQLIIDGKGYGVHGFLVRIRNPDHTVVQGVRIEDMGHKFGCNGGRSAVGSTTFNAPDMPSASCLQSTMASCGSTTFACHGSLC